MLNTPNDHRLPIRRTPLVLLIGVILLVLWAQSGFRLDQVHALFLTSNYLTWLLLLSSINAWVIKLFKPVPVLEKIGQMIAILLIHWLISNSLFYLIRYVWLAYPPLPEMEELMLILFPSLLSRLIDFALFGGLFLFFHQRQRIAEQQRSVVLKDAEVQRQQLQSLKKQLNPHFLFNALNNIAALIGEDDGKARNLTISVSQLLRKLLKINESDDHFLDEELEFVQQYVSIEAERFHDRVSIDQNIHVEDGSMRVPTMILQPLVENAFKHGIAKITGASTLTIYVEQKENHLRMEVTNELPEGKASPTTSGIGLRNLRDRLQMYYGEKAQLDVLPSDRHFQACITIDLSV